MDNAKLKQPKPLSLSKSLKISYMKTNEEKKRALKKHGFRLDEDLSSHNQTIAYNPLDKKLLQTTAGTHNVIDWNTNKAILFGDLGVGFKNTKRYKEAERTLYKAREKYGDRHSTVLTGHSQGATTTIYLPMDDTTKAYTLNGGYTFGQKISNRGGKLQNYRLKGDPVSILAEGDKNMTTLMPDDLSKTSMFRPFSSMADIHKQYAKNARIII